MSNIFLISDTHFGQENSWKKFKLEDGVTPLRPFSSTEEMDETMIANWNSVVRPNDKVYHLGDVAMCNKTKLRSIFSRLNGIKVLIKGNHDEDNLSFYAELFKDIRASHLLDKLILTHIPIHAASLLRWRGNIHGHLHSYTVKAPGFVNSQGMIMYHDNVDDLRYECVSVERINFTPVPFETINHRFKSRGI